MSEAQPRLVTYLDPECTLPLEGDTHDLGETMIDDGHVETSKLYVRNEGDRTWHVTAADLTDRPDVKFHYSTDTVKPGEVLELTADWDTSLAVDDLRYSFRLAGKYYPFQNG